MSEQTAQNADFDVMHADNVRRVELAIEDMRAGKMVILVDDEDRENEGDLVIAAEKITPEAINFMATHARGLICLSLTSEQVEKLGLSMMASHNQSAYHTAFTVSIEAREGVTTGISAADRAATVLAAVDPEATPHDIVTPGHIFPLRARDGGVLERVGQTEGSVDMAKMAGLHPSGVICEIMNDDGTMARLDDLIAFGKHHGIRVVTVADLIKYRMRSERVVRRESEGEIDIPGLGLWKTRLYRGLGSGGLHQAIWKGDLGESSTLARVQGAPPPWAFVDAQSPSTEAARHALGAIAQEGRGVFVMMHLAAPLDLLQSQFVRQFEGSDSQATRQARSDAFRDLGTGCQILLDLGLRDLRLLTSSRRPIVGIEAYGLRIVERLPVFVGKR